MLKFAVIAMGVLIVVGVATLAVLIVRRVTPAGGRSTAVTLGEPAGTAIAGTALSGDRISVQLHGGGPDRVVVLDAASGRVVARVGVQ